LEDCKDCDPNATVNGAEIKKNGWLGFNGVVTAVDIRAGAFAVKTKERQYTVYVTGQTIICNRGKRARLGDAKIGRPIGGFTKLTNGKSVAVIVGIGAPSEIHPYAIPVPGKTFVVESPYVRGQYVNVKGRKTGDEIRDPYTQRIFIVP
jgi:hypothetical protein